MFGISRKKKPAAKQLLSFADDEEEEDTPSPTVERKRKRKDKKKKSSMLSFDPEDGVDNNTAEKKKRSKQQKKRGMGYGGMSMEDEMEVDEEQQVDQSSLYDVAALEKLKMEQMHRKEKVQDSGKPRISLGQQQPKDESDKEEEYISLSGTKTTSSPVVLAGDDAMAYVQDDEPTEFDHGLEQHKSSQTTDTSRPEETNEEIEQDNRQWEDNMARRAGVLPPKSAKSNSPRKDVHLPPPTALSQIKSSLQPTISNLQNISLDLETAIHRHMSTLSTTKDELEKHQSTIQDDGAALEYYQVLRSELADWMGALRQIQSMVDLVYDAKCNWEGSVTLTRFQRGYEWSEDVLDVLRTKGLIDRVVGCDDWNEYVEEDGGVDEFGRDLSSMATMARTKRWEVRRRNFLRMKHGDEVDAQILTLQETMNCLGGDNISSDQISDWKSRDQALKEALAIIPSVVNDDYLSISNLCNLFFRWQDKYPEDYKSCYAEMTLVSMVSVLARLEMCQRWDGLGLAGDLDGNHKNDSMVCDVDEFRWFKDLRMAAKNRSNDSNDSSELFREVMEKCIVSPLLAYLTVDSTIRGATKNQKWNGLYNPASTSQTQWLCNSISSLLSCLSADSIGKRTSSKPIMSKVTASVLALLKYYVDQKSIVIINANNVMMMNDCFADKDGKEFDTETNDAIAFAIFAQANELGLVAANVLTYWYPIMNGSAADGDDVISIIQFILMEVISLRILPVLQVFQSVIKTQQGSEKHHLHEMHQSLLKSVYDAVSSAGLLEKDEWKLCTVP